MFQPPADRATGRFYLVGSTPPIRPEAVAAELDTTDLHIEADQLFARVGAAAEAIDALIACNARVAQDQGEYQRRFDKLNTDHALLLDEYHQQHAGRAERERRDLPRLA